MKEYILSFGDNRYMDYTMHKDADRKERYINRHNKREVWTVAGISTAGFQSRWPIWNLPTLEASTRDVFTRLNINIT